MKNIKDAGGEIKGIKKVGQVTISGLKVPVYTAKDILQPEGKPGRVLGVARYDEKDVFVRAGLGAEMRKLVFLHELFHQIDDVEGAGLTEEQVDKMSRGVYDFLVNNPKWMAIVE